MFSVNIAQKMTQCREYPKRDAICKDQWKELSTLARSFVTSLLTVNQSARPSAQDALNNPWLCIASATPSNRNGVASAILAIPEPPVACTFARACAMLILWMAAQHRSSAKASYPEDPNTLHTHLTGARARVDTSSSEAEDAGLNDGRLAEAIRTPEKAAPLGLREMFQTLRMASAKDVSQALRPFHNLLTAKQAWLATSCLKKGGRRA